MQQVFLFLQQFFSGINTLTFLIYKIHGIWLTITQRDGFSVHISKKKKNRATEPHTPNLAPLGTDWLLPG